MPDRDLMKLRLFTALLILASLLLSLMLIPRGPGAGFFGALSEEEQVFYDSEAAPKTGDRWRDMDYGPFLTASIEAPWPPGNIAYKGIAIRFDKVYGRHHREAVVFDTDLLRYSVGWEGSGFVDLKGVAFDGSHETHPRISGEALFANPKLPGWSFQPEFIDSRQIPYGPLPREHGHFKGLYLHHNRVILSYSVGKTSVLEMPGLERVQGLTAFSRELDLRSLTSELFLQVAAGPGQGERILSLDGRELSQDAEAGESIAVLGGVGRVTAAAVVGAPPGTRWRTDLGRIRLQLPAISAARLKLLIWSGAQVELDSFRRLAAQALAARDLRPLTKGGPRRWRQTLTTSARMGDGDGPYVIDEITAPEENPWDSWMRFGGFDFFEDESRAAICTWNGDVWVVSGLTSALRRLRWQRMASGLFQPLGLQIVDDQIYVLGRDQITLLHDLNGDGEADYYENFNNDHQVTEHFHEFAMDLQQGADGDFYYMKGGRHALDAVIPRHGTLIRVSRDGSQSEILANGFRAPNGLLTTPEGEFWSSDQQGHWTPANRINLIQPGEFHGYLWSYHQGEPPTDFVQPLAWIHPGVDRSPSSFVKIDSDRWGPFQDRILGLSYGTGKIELIFRQDIDPISQGGLTPFPLNFNTGIMRGRFRESDGQLYVCGLFGWAGNRTRAGGFYRVRYTGKSVLMPEHLEVARDGVFVRFTEPLHPDSALDRGSYHAQVWNYRWREEYGSPDYRLDGREGRDSLTLRGVALSPDARTVFLDFPNLTPVMQMHMDFNLRSTAGTGLRSFVHHTIHRLGTVSGWERIGDDWRVGNIRVDVQLGEEAPGLIQEVRSVSEPQVEAEARVSRLAALHVEEGSAPSALVPAGAFRSRWRGYLRLPLNEMTVFHVEGQGHTRLEINGAPLLEGAGGVDGITSEPVDLRQGFNRIVLDYDSPERGDARLRLRWSTNDRPAEPVPLSALVHDALDNALREGESARRGRRLFADNFCIRCHQPGDWFEGNLMPELERSAPALDGIGSRRPESWLRDWLLDPRGMKNHAAMPRLLSRSRIEGRQQATDLALFLATRREEPAGRSQLKELLRDENRIEAGRSLYAWLGCKGCHSLDSEPADSSLLSLAGVERAWKREALIEYLHEPEKHDPWSRMPNFSLSRQEAADLAAYLWSSTAAATQGVHGSGNDGDRGRDLVSELGCLNCHELEGLSTRVEAPPFGRILGIDWETGCLAEDDRRRGRAPAFPFSTQQRADLNLFLRDFWESLRQTDWTDFATRQIEALRCNACHERDGEAARWTLSNEPRSSPQTGPVSSKEGSDGETIHQQIPPITWAGEQFRPGWLHDLLAGRLPGKTRPRLATRMPSFPAYASGLARGLAGQHGLPITEVRDRIDERKAEVGKILIETTALGCVQCHPVAGRAALAGPDTETIDLAQISRRLRLDFYMRFLRDPQRIRPGTMMPTFWLEDGRSTLRSFYDGDGAQQAEALGHYMRELEK